MKKNILLLIAPVVLLLVLIAFGYRLAPTAPTSSVEDAKVLHVNHKTAVKPTTEGNWIRVERTTRSAGDYSNAAPQPIIDYALSLLGSPYQYAGITPAGFDCSGFITHVFDTHNIAIPHSSALQASEGIPVTKAEAAPGDLVIFTGTNEKVREPGHVGIVISEPGDTISFVHSSSNGGVKISKVQGTRYDVRFLEVRRVL
ncbi:C40 family peptidase [Pontibacter sp. KCTC 32443]|uniref:C40 family peptidase n=1 Tax=Pontibacter TaxID=323449 RepID=UPI00164EB967|nr:MULTISPECIES: C40 family peptidase [Pontibacter]MBC5773219.1 C40 family peptidase [Pontibacter sp. KCTC 32443]